MALTNKDVTISKGRIQKAHVHVVSPFGAALAALASKADAVDLPTVEQSRRRAINID